MGIVRGEDLLCRINERALGNNWNTQRRHRAPAEGTDQKVRINRRCSFASETQGSTGGQNITRRRSHTSKGNKGSGEVHLQAPGQIHTKRSAGQSLLL